jgi:hypothetical protein
LGNDEIRPGGKTGASTTRTASLLYCSLRAVKVLLASLRSTLTVLAPREEVDIGSRWRSSCCGHWPACPSFNEMIEHDLSPRSFAPDADHRAIASSILSIAVMHPPFAHRSKSSPEYLADLQNVHVRRRLRSRAPRGSVGLARWLKYPADLISAEQPLQYDIG